MDKAKIAYCKIYPAIGIVRVGDSTESKENEGWFIGPELNDSKSAESFIAKDRLSEFKYCERSENFSFKDSDGKIKKQAARFRIYAFDKNDNPIGELTSEQAQITWRVSLANKKASWFRFEGARKAINAFNGEKSDPDNDNLPSAIRNPSIGEIVLDEKNRNYLPSEKRTQFLEIKSEEKEIKGNSITEGPTLDGKFKNVKDVYLGELKTDEKGRLIVLGGNGISDAIDDKGESIKSKRWIRNYANNDDWFDDISDGPVKAEVILNDAKTSIEVKGGAWVVVAPPDFAPDVKNIVTLYDVMEEVAYNNPSLNNPTTPKLRKPALTNFQQDIKPVLINMHDQKWVSSKALKGHGSGKPGNFQKGNDPEQLIIDLTTDSPKGKMIREKIISHLRQPAYVRYVNLKPEKDKFEENEIIAQAKGTFMPPLSGDEGDVTDNEPATWLTLTYLQYERFMKWQAKPQNNPTDEPENNKWKIELDALTKTILGNCCGGAFFPGIEMTSTIRIPRIYSEAFRLNNSLLKAGDITKYMACPWQADFWECQQHWWPAQRPDNVIPDEEFDEIFGKFTEDVGENYEKVLFNRIRWDRGLGIKERPSNSYLISRILPEVPKDVSLPKYIDLISGLLGSSEDEKDKFLTKTTKFDSLGRIFSRLMGSNISPNYSPWRMKYVAQESLDSYSGLYFKPAIPSPEIALRDLFKDRVLKAELKKLGISSLLEIRQEWEFLTSKNQEVAGQISSSYRSAINKQIIESIKKILTSFVNSLKNSPDRENDKVTITEFVSALKDQSVKEIEEREYLFSDFTDKNDKYYIIRAVEMIENAVDNLYLWATNYSGDMDMVNDWKKMGFVVNNEFEWFDTVEEKTRRNLIRIEKDRSKYDGKSFRDYFYYLMNIQDFPDFIPYAKVIVNDVLLTAKNITDAIDIFDINHPESFVPYSKETFNAKMEEIYEILREQAAGALGWRTDRNRELAIRRIYDNAVFNQTDGAWLRFIANAGTIDKVNSLLFEVWSDEIGNGNPALHHGNLYTNLLESLGIYLPPINSRNYADNPAIDESGFIAPVFQLAISQHSEFFYPEIIGMTLFLEWEVLSLVPGIKRTEYLGLDAHFWQMHVGIDNPTHGHGAKAKEAVEIYLDRILKESGQAAVQSEWKRIWNGFVAFAIAGEGYFGSDLTIGRKHKGNPQDEIIKLIQRKAHYGGLNHNGKNLGGHRLNDLFDEPNFFVEELANSPYIVAGKPEESKLINYLTTYEGPMYKVFDEQDLELWKNWIVWLGKEGDTDTLKMYQSKAKSMYLLLQELRELARSVSGHNMYSINGSPIAKYFELGKIEELMKEFRDNDNNGWIKRWYPDKSPLIVDLARANRPMGAILDKRFPQIGNQIGRIIIMKWIEAGCPLLGEEDKAPEIPPPSKVWDGKRLLVQQIGMGAVH